MCVHQIVLEVLYRFEYSFRKTHPKSTDKSELREEPLHVVGNKTKKAQISNSFLSHLARQKTCYVQTEHPPNHCIVTLYMVFS